jgi:hypothetical protein
MDMVADQGVRAHQAGTRTLVASVDIVAIFVAIKTHGGLLLK